MNLTWSQPSESIYTVDAASAIDKTHTGLLQGPWIPRSRHLSSTERKDFMENVMLVLSHEQVGGKEGIWNSRGNNLTMVPR